MRAIWKGALSFSLVNVPVSIYPAVRHETLKFRLLRKTDLSPVNYKRVAVADGQEVGWDQIVKGYEYEKGKFVVLREEDFQRVDLEATQKVDIIDFVSLDEINPIFFDKPYYLEPRKGGEKSYALLREALKKTKKVGIAKVVIRTRQHLAAVKPQNQVLVLELMHFAQELVQPTRLKVPTSLNVGQRELEMAMELVDSLTDAWDPAKYTDDYRSALLKLIEKKIESGGKGPPPPKPLKRPPSKMIDLVAVLRESLAQMEESAPPAASAKPPNRKRRPKAA